MKRLRRIGWTISILLVLVCVSGYVGITQIAPYAIIKPYRFNPTDHPEQFPNGVTPASFGLDYTDFDVTIGDSITLKGYFVPSNLDTAYGTFLVLHGIGSCKEHQLPLARKLADLGLNVMLYDSRAQGASGGTYCSYGYFEKQDVQTILNRIEEKYGPQRFGIWGNSFGAAVSIQALAVDKRFQLGVVESPFARLRDIVFDYQERMIGVSSHWVSNMALAEAERVAGFDANEVQPALSAKEIQVPVLIAHGKADKRISIQYGVEIFKNLPNLAKEFVQVEGGHHVDLWQVGGIKYEQQLLGFIRKQWQIPN